MYFARIYYLIFLAVVSVNASAYGQTQYGEVALELGGGKASQLKDDMSPTFHAGLSGAYDFLKLELIWFTGSGGLPDSSTVRYYGWQSRLLFNFSYGWLRVRVGVGAGEESLKVRRTGIITNETSGVFPIVTEIALERAPLGLGLEYSRTWSGIGAEYMLLVKGRAIFSLDWLYAD
jgi:hypothetical protein